MGQQPLKTDFASADFVSAGTYLAIASIQTCIALAHSARAISASSKQPKREHKSDKPGLIEGGERRNKTQKNQQPDCHARYSRPGAEPKHLLASAVLFNHRHSANASEKSAANLHIPVIKISALFYGCTLAKQRCLDLRKAGFK